MYRKVRQYASIFDHFSMIEPNHDHSLIRKFGMDKSMDFKIQKLSIEFIVLVNTTSAICHYLQRTCLFLISIKVPVMVV